MEVFVKNMSYLLLNGFSMKCHKIFKAWYMKMSLDDSKHSHKEKKTKPQRASGLVLKAIPLSVQRELGHFTDRV